MKNNVKSKKLIIYIFGYLLLSILIIISAIYIINFLLLKEEAKNESKLLDTVEINNNEKENTEEKRTKENDKLNEQKNEIENIETERMIKVKELKKENEDVVGWLEIENTSINYPVLQGEDNEYYMTHNYKKQKSKNGSIFLNKDYDWNIPSSNLLIYGHNLNNGTMFQELLKYQNKEFYMNHPIIRFTTEKEDAEYEIISVFKSRVYYKSEENVFRYYYFINANTEEEYNKFVKDAKEASLYEIEETAKYGDQLITLSTCSYHVKDGRFAVVGRKNKKIL